MEMSEFEDIIEATVKKMPARFRKILKNEGIRLIARGKTPGVLQDRYRGDWVFGVFLGVPYNQRSVFNVEQEPTRIELYRESFEKAFRRRREMEEQIARTVIHEIGHYFGFSEKDLRRHRL
ncbi:MAG TPA: metallopeptidase family protein [Elusimicrobiota bacterium]|nr:metallopeptidase family protein [Elusimicrobiota bacterium]